MCNAFAPFILSIGFKISNLTLLQGEHMCLLIQKRPYIFCNVDPRGLENYDKQKENMGHNSCMWVRFDI